mmetsp:Transcript_22509/g.57658  ORF Transcript_22509/g.57658 Transcript_22509/m.57658 type:complete len:285 (+) Transcript_22509:113-967(+)
MPAAPTMPKSAACVSRPSSASPAASSFMLSQMYCRARINTSVPSSALASSWSCWMRPCSARMSPSTMTRSEGAGSMRGGVGSSSSSWTWSNNPLARLMAKVCFPAHARSSKKEADSVEMVETVNVPVDGRDEPVAPLASRSGMSPSPASSAAGWSAAGSVSAWGLAVATTSSSLPGGSPASSCGCAPSPPPAPPPGTRAFAFCTRCFSIFTHSAACVCAATLAFSLASLAASSCSRCDLARAAAAASCSALTSAYLSFARAAAVRPGAALSTLDPLLSSPGCRR